MITKLDRLSKAAKKLSEKSNIYKEEIYGHDYVDTESEFITGCQKKFVTEYKEEHFAQLLVRIPKVESDFLRETQPKLTMQKRMYVINWLFQETQKTKSLDDETFIF